MTQVATIRDISDRYPQVAHSLTCPKGCGRFTSDLERYDSLDDDQSMVCPRCDAVLWFRMEAGDDTDPPANRITLHAHRALGAVA